MAKLVLLVACLSVALVAARPLQWYGDESYDASVHSAVAKDMSHAVERDWQWPTSPAHMHEMSSATSFLQTTTGGHPLECDCERVKCNCVKRCECGLPAAAQNRQAAQFIELASATGKNSAPLWVDVDTNECFLETGESVGQDTHHMLDCECDKVKCNCVKHCECSLPAAASGAGGAPANDLLQLAEGSTKAHQKDEEVEAEDQDVPESAPAPETPKEAAPAPKQRSRLSKVAKSKSDSGSASGSASGSGSASSSGSASASGSSVSKKSYSYSNEYSNEYSNNE